MGMRANVEMNDAEIKLGGDIAEAAVRLGYWDNERECVATFSHQQIIDMIYFAGRSGSMQTDMDYYKRAVLMMWVCTSDPQDTITFM